MSPVAEYIKNVGKSVAYAAYDYTTDTMPATSEFIKTNNELFSDVYHSVIDLRRTIDKGMKTVQNTPLYRQGSKAFHNAIEDIKTGKLYNSEREDSVMSESFNMDDFNMDNLDSGSSSSEGSSMTMGEKSIMSATQESANKISHTTVAVIEASTNYSVEAAKQNATMLYAQSVKTNSTLEGGFKAVTAGMEALYKFDTEVVQTMANNSKIYFETTTKIMQENNAILKEMLEMQRNLYKRDNNAKNENDPLFNIMGANVDIKEYAKQIFKNAKSLISDKTWGMSDMITEDMLKQFAANPLKSLPTLMISTAIGPAIKSTMQNLDKTLGGMFGSFLSKMNYQASQNSWGGSLGKEIMGKLFGVQLSAKETIDTSDMNSKITPMERSVVEVIPSHLSRIEAALTGNPARVYDSKKGKWTNMAAIKSSFKKDKENAILFAGYEETSEMKGIMNKLVENQAMNRDQVKHMEDVIQKINRKRFDDGGWLDRSGSSIDKAMRYGVSEEEWNLFEQLYSNVSRGARANTPGRFMRERLDRNRKLKNAEASGNDVLRLLFNDFDPANSLNLDSKKLQETSSTLGQNILYTKDKHGMTVFDYLRDIDLNTMYGGGGGSRRSRRRGTDDRSLREQELANRHANGMREGAAAGGDSTITTADAGNESDNSRQINNLNINQADLISAAGAVKDARREQQMEENRTFITKYINEKIATEVQKMKANGASAQEIAKYRETMKKMVDTASEGGRFGAMIEAIQHLTARPVGVITGIMEQADKHIFNILFEEEDRDDKDEEGKPAKGFFGKLKNRLDEVFTDIKDKINKRDEEIGNTNLSLFQKANALIKEYTGVDVRQNLKNMKQGVINTGKSALNQVKGALEGTARDIGLESWVDKLGKMRESNTDANNASQTSTAADGARNVTKTGLTILSKGERVIPADQNIYNPDMRKVNRADNRRDEAKIKQQLINKVRDANMMADGGTIDENGNAVKDDTKEKSLFAQFGERIGVWDTDNDKKITNMTQKEVEKHLPAVAGGGTAGAVIATATGLGGPLVGAIAGAAINIAANSETFQKKLFGDRIYDETTGADTGKRKGGIFGQEIQDTMNKYLPDAKKYGITGSVLGLVTPLGPLGGLMMGSAISFLKNNETAKNALFGENGLIGQDTEKTLRKAFPTISKTAIAGLLAGGVSGIGLIPGALVGAGIGLVSTTDEFKDFLLGTPDKDGKRVGGVAGAIKEGLVDPLKSVGRSVKDNFLDWFKVKMTKPIVDAMAPMGKQLQLGVTDVFKWGKNLAKRIVNSRTGVSLLNRVRYSKAGRAAGWLGKKAFGGAKGVGSAAKWVIERPSAIIGGVGNRLRKHQIKDGNADYMTAQERLKFMGDEDYDMRDFDESINGTTNEGIEEIRKKFGEIDEGKNFLEKEHNSQLKKMGNHVAKGIKDTGRTRQIMDSVRSGNMERAIKLVESSKMSERDKSKMIQFINDEGKKLRDIAMRRDNFKADRGEMFKQLEKMGMKGINENNYEKYKKYFETEAAKRSKQDKENSEALDTTDPAAMQAAEINMTLKSGFDEQIPLLEKMTAYLGQMVAEQGGMTSEQVKALEGMKQTGLEAESKANKKRIRDARRKSIALKRAFGGKKKITAENQMNLLDMKNSERKHMMRIAHNGLQLDDVNNVLELKGKDKDRWFALADYGYNITDMKLINGMSNRDFNKLMILAKAGIPITNIKAISKYDEHECEIMAKLFGQGMEIAQGGLYEFARKGDMTEDEFATKKGMVNNLEGSYEERIGLNHQEGVEQFSTHHTKQSRLARMGESMKESAQGMAHDAMADIGQKVYGTTHGFNNKNHKSGAINNAGVIKGTGAIEEMISRNRDVENIPSIAAAAANSSSIHGHADGGKITKDEVAVVSKGERIESSNSDKEKEDQDKEQTQEPDKAQVQKKESELDKATKDTKKDKKKNTSIVNTEYGPQEYMMSSDGSMVVAKTKQSMAVQKRILDRDNTQKELLASIKELVATNKESLKHSIAGVGKKAKKGLFDLLKDLNPLNLLKKYGAAIASVLGPFAPLLFKGINAVGGLVKKGLGWAGGKILDKAKDVGSKVLNKALNTKIGQKIVNSKVGKFARKIGGKLFGGSTNDTDLDTSTPTNELEAINVHGSNTEKLLTQILEAIKGNSGGRSGDKPNPVPGFDDFEPDIPGRRRRKNSGKNGKEGKNVSTPSDVSSGGKKGGKKANGRLGKLLALGGGIASGLGLGNMFGGNDTDEDVENDTGASQMDLANNNNSTMDMVLDAGSTAMDIKDATDVASERSSKFANLMNKGKEAVSEAASATKENINAIVQKVESGFKTVISKCGALLGGAAKKLTTFKDWVIKKITTPACMKKILAKAGKHAAAYGASATGVGVVVTVGMEVGFAMSSFYDGYNDAERLLQIPAGTATTGMKMLCGFVSAALQAIPIIGWVLEPDDVMQGAVSTIGPVFGVSEDDLNKVREVGDKTNKDLSQITTKIAETAEKAKDAAGSVFSNYAGYGQNMDGPGKTGDNKNQSVWDKFKGFGSELIDKAGGAASKVYNWVKDKAGAAVQGAKDMAKSAYDAAASAVDTVKGGVQKVGAAVSNEYEYAKNKGKSLFGYGKYGRGKWGRGFQSQQDPSIAGQSFNVQGDTSPETVDERACAETTGVNVLSALGMPTSSNDVLDAVDFAAGRGHVAPDDGTKDTFFKDYLGQYGVQTRHINPSSAGNTNNPVILMGEDKSNTPDKESKGLSKTPYGDQPHYVLGMGTDNNGNMTVVDPDTPDATPQKYRASDVLNHSSLAIEAGMGKFSNKHGRGRWGKDGDDSKDKNILSKAADLASSAASDVKDKVGSAIQGAKNLAKSAYNAVTGGDSSKSKSKQPAGAAANRNGAPTNAQLEFGGIFGDLADAASALSEGFSLSSPGGGNKSNSSGGNISGSNQLNMDYIESNHPGDEETTNLSNINPQVKTLVNKFAESYFKRHDKKLMITGGAELGYHSKGIWSHGNGYKTDITTDINDEDKDEMHKLGASVNLENDHYDVDWSGHDIRDQDHPKNAIYDSQPPTEAKGKWRFGRGKDDNNVLAMAAANADALNQKVADTKISDISQIADYQSAMTYIQEVPQDQIPEYNMPNPNDSISVLRAKCKKIRENFEKKQNGKGKRKSIWGHAKRAISKNPVIKAFNEYMNGRGPRVVYGAGKWGKGDGAHIWDYLKEQGLGSSAIAGIMGNMQAESFLESNIVQGGGHADEITVDGSTGYGLCQWTDRGRQQGLVDFANARGTSTSDVDTQLDYMLHEIDKSHAGLLQKMDGMNPYDAALLFHEEYEASADSPEQAARRGDFANQIAQSEGRGEVFNGTRTGGGGAPKKKRGLFGKLTQMATALSDKMKKAIAPMASAITSGAEKIFGKDTISAIFGDANPFSSIFGSPSGGKSGGGGGSFASASSDEGIRKASTYAESRVGTEGYGNSGCTTWCQVYLKQAGNPFADEMSLHVPTLMEQAKQKGIWKEADEPGCEGDIALLESVGDRSDGPNHAVIYDGRGGCWGNSSSKNKILHYDNMLASFPGGLWGYVATGSGGGTVATKEGKGQSAADSTLDGQGKWSSKWGKGRKRPLRLPARARHGKGLLDDLMGKQRDPKKELEMQAKLVKDKANDAGGDHGIKTMKDVAAYIKDIPKASIPKYNRIKKGDSIAVASAKAIKAKQMYEEQVSKDPKADPSIKMAEDVSKMLLPQNTLAKDNKPAVSDPDNPLSGNDGINSIESAKQYISGLPEDYKNNIPEYNRINDDDSITVARAKALKIMEQYKKTAKNQPQDTTQEPPAEASTPTTEQPAEGKGKWGSGFGSWLKRIGGTIGDAATGLWKGMTQPGGIFGGPAAPFLKPLNSKDTKDNKKSLADEFENDIKYIMTAKEWQDKSGRNPSRAEAIEILKKDKKYQGKINDDGTLKDESNKAENQKAAEKIDTSYNENDITYIMTAREWQDSEGRNPSRAEAEKILQEQAKAGKGKWGRRHHHRKRIEQVSQPVNAVQTPVQNPFQTEDNPYGLNTMQDCLNLQSTIPEDFIAKYPYNRIDPENDSLTVAKAKVTKLAQLFDQQPAAQGKWGRGFGSWLKRIGGSIGDVATQMWHNFTGQNKPVQPTAPEKKEKSKEEILENDIRYIMTAKEWQDKDGRNPSRAEAIAILNKDKKYNGSIDKDGKLIEKKTANDVAKEAVKNPGTVKTPTITKPEDIKTVDDAFNYISDIPDSFIEKYPYNKIDPEKDDLGVVKSKAIKLRKLYDDELAKTGTTKMESKMAAQTIDPNKPAETNTTEKNAQKTAEKASIVEKKEETKETSTPTKANDVVSDDSGIKAPNGKNYSNNDINYLVKQGYTKDAAIELLSKDKKYAATTPTTTKTSDTKSSDSNNATGSGEYNDKFDTMINLLASIAQSVAVIAGTPAPQVAGAATTDGTKNTTVLQRSTDAKVQANRKAAAQINSQNMQDMFAGIATAMQKLARG